MTACWLQALENRSFKLLTTERCLWGEVCDYNVLVSLDALPNDEDISPRERTGGIPALQYQRLDQADLFHQHRSSKPPPVVCRSLPLACTCIAACFVSSICTPHCLVKLLGDNGSVKVVL